MNNNTNKYNTEYGTEKLPDKGKRKDSLDSLVRRIHKETREEVRGYFNQRGINNNSIDRFQLGLRKFGGYDRYVIPVFDKTGKVAYLKLRRTLKDEPADVLSELMGQETTIDKYAVYPDNAELILVGEDDLQKSTSSDVLICRGELDRIIAIQEGVKMPVVTGGGIVQTFKDSWIDSLRDMRNIYLCLGEDGVGKRGVEKLAKRLAKRIPTASIYKVTLPTENNEYADLTNYFVDKKGTAEELFTKYAEYYCGAEPIDASQFKEIGVSDVADVLDSTIKNNRVNKVITFLAMLLAYTEDSQLNVMFNAQSSTGKTYITLEVAKYFPAQDVKIYGRTSKTAFYYNENLMKTDNSGKPYIDLERRILVFAEQPDMQLLENLRSFLSHDMKKTPFVLTNKSKNGRNTASETYLLGFSSTIFCSANLRVDEQEQSRSLLLSPESTEETVRAGIDESIARNSDKNAYLAKLSCNKERKQLMDRVLYVKSLNVDQIIIGDSDYLRKRFYERIKNTPPKAQRQISHFISLVKGIALLNAPFRMEAGRIVASRKDVDEAKKLWDVISVSMSYGVPPQALDFYRNIIIPAYNELNKGRAKKKGITYDQLALYCYKATGNYPNLETVRKGFFPVLEGASLMRYEKDEDDKRRMLITPQIFFDDELEK